LPAIAEDGAWRRGNALMAAGSRREALEEFEKVKDAWWDDPVAMYQLAIAWRASSAYRLSVLCADRLYRLSPTARRAQLPLLIQQLTHPIYFEPLVVAQAQAQQIDPLLLFALIRQESLFEPSATSSADARGLAQVIPDTGEWIAGRLKWSGWQPEDLWRPYISVEFGAWYLAVQLAAFDGQVMPALAAYNAGPGNVQKWLAATPDLDLFAETMAFSEPRRYVRSIYEGYYTYRRLYRP
jgi:soluble lytic murein transglycosylase